MNRPEDSAIQAGAAAPQAVAEALDLSIVVPMHNENDNVRPLYEELVEVMADSGLRYELILVNDGSWDGTSEQLQQIAREDCRVTVIEFTRCYGQTAALGAGFKIARGRIFVPMDGDLQNDPRDIAALVAKLEEGRGYDVVSGWRKNRKDKLLTRRLPSVLANRLVGKVTWTPIHDFGCTLKAYRREVLEGEQLYGEMHRYLPAIAKWRGARVTEMVVNHRPRKHGVSKYGLRRTVKVLLDLVTIKFLGDYMNKPLYFFGKISMLSMLAAFACGLVSLYQKYVPLMRDPLPLNRNIFFMFTIMLFLLTVVFILMGVISELLVRIYHESQGRTPYRIRRIIRGGDPRKH